MLAAYDTEVYPHTPYITDEPKLATLLLGWNDINQGLTAQEVYDGQAQIIQRLRGEGCYIAHFVPPRPNAWAIDSAEGIVWAELVALIAANSAGADMVYRLDLLLPDPTDLTYYISLGDSHFTTAGNRLIATDFEAAAKTHFGW